MGWEWCVGWECRRCRGVGIEVVLEVCRDVDVSMHWGW